MGRFAEPLADQFVEFAGVSPGLSALDVGCGPGALTERLVGRLGADHVAGVDPSAPFLEAVAARCPGVELRAGTAEQLPFADAGFDHTLAQLVVHFMSDPQAGLREMGRVTVPGGTVSACVWDHAGGSGPLSEFWAAVREMDPGAPDESGLPGAREGHLAELCEAAGLSDVESGRLSVRVRYETFGDWWEPYLLGVGPAGAHVAALDDVRRAELADRCRARLPEPPFDVLATAWTVRSCRP